jgi:hypothetical protein
MVPERPPAMTRDCISRNLGMLYAPTEPANRQGLPLLRDFLAVAAFFRFLSPLASEASHRRRKHDAYAFSACIWLCAYARISLAYLHVKVCNRILLIKRRIREIQSIKHSLTAGTPRNRVLQKPHDLAPRARRRFGQIALVFLLLVCRC